MHLEVVVVNCKARAEMQNSFGVVLVYLVPGVCLLKTGYSYSNFFN